MHKIFVHIIFALAALFMSGCVSDKEEQGEGSLLAVGDMMPEFQVSGPYGEIDSGDFAGKRGFIVFFASYCSDCRNTMGRIQEVWDRLGGDGNYVIAVISRQSDGETPVAVAGYWSEKGYTMPYYLDADRVIYSKFASITIPRLYVIDEQGRIEWMAADEPTESAQELVDLIR